MFRIYGKHDGLECSTFLGVSESLEEANMLICGHRWGFLYNEVVTASVVNNALTEPNASKDLT